MLNRIDWIIFKTLCMYLEEEVVDDKAISSKDLERFKQNVKGIIYNDGLEGSNYSDY